MTSTPHSIEIRVYNVGFGDCILLTFRTRTNGRSKKLESYRVLIDFGSTGRNSDGPTLLEVAKHIVEDCRSKDTTAELDAIVVTHRHRDHLSGFGGQGGAYLVENLTAPPKVILQPWTEDPQADDPQVNFHDESTGAAKHIKALRMSQAITASILKEIQVRHEMGMDRDTDEEAMFYGTKNLPFAKREDSTTGSALSSEDVLNAEELSNEDAVERLLSWQKGQKKPAYEFLSAGQKTELGAGKLIPHLKVDVLGPAGPQFWEALKQHGDADELWKRLSSLSDDQPLKDESGANEFVAFDTDQGPYGVKPIFNATYQVPNTESRKDNVRWLVEQLDALRGRQLLSFVRVLDSYLNNTSLVLYIEFGPMRMLFPGDAEVASWQLISTVTDSDGVRENSDVVGRLRNVDVYKVGHHGSNNATPRLSLWRYLVDSRRAAHTLHCLLSTQATRFKNKIPNVEFYETMQNCPNLQLLTTALPFGDSGTLHEPSGWKVVRDRSQSKVVAYARTFLLDNTTDD